MQSWHQSEDYETVMQSIFILLFLPQAASLNVF